MEIFLMRHATTAQLYVVEGFAKAPGFLPDFGVFAQHRSKN
jgi:hypothetical protein